MAGQNSGCETSGEGVMLARQNGGCEYPGGMSENFRSGRMSAGKNSGCAMFGWNDGGGKESECETSGWNVSGEGFWM